MYGGEWRCSEKGKKVGAVASRSSRALKTFRGEFLMLRVILEKSKLEAEQCKKCQALRKPCTRGGRWGVFVLFPSTMTQRWRSVRGAASDPPYLRAKPAGRG